jgi:hypothetical protein
MEYAFLERNCVFNWIVNNIKYSSRNNFGSNRFLSVISNKILLRIIIVEPIPEFITASLNLELGIINEFLIMKNSSETFIDLRKNLVLG